MRTIVILLAIGAICASAGAQTFTFEHDTPGITMVDGRVRSGRDTNWSGARVLCGGALQPSPFIVDGIFGDDPGQIPAGTAITRAYLHAYMYHNVTSAGDQTMHVHPLNIDLRPHIGNKDGEVEAGEMTWYWKAWDTVGWGADETGNDGPVAGEDYNTDVFVEFTAEDLPGPDAHVDEWYDVDITPIVQAWSDYESNPATGLPNHGVILVGTETSGMYFRSTEMADLEPSLVVQIGGIPPCDPGDADKDGDVDDDDLSLLLANWGQDVTGDIDGGCGKGEFSETAPVNDDDLSLLLANWTGPLDDAVPQPMTIVLLVGAVPVLWRPRR